MRCRTGVTYIVRTVQSHTILQMERLLGTHECLVIQFPDVGLGCYTANVKMRVLLRAPQWRYLVVLTELQ